MGSQMKRSIFDEQTNRALKKWHQAVRKRHKGNSPSPTITPGSSPGTSPTSSPIHLLHRYKTIGHSDMIQAKYSDLENERSEIIETTPYSSDQDNSETENDKAAMMTYMIPSFKHSAVEAETAELRLDIDEERDEEFTFVKPTEESELILH